MSQYLLDTLRSKTTEDKHLDQLLNAAAEEIEDQDEFIDNLEFELITYKRLVFVLFVGTILALMI